MRGKKYLDRVNRELGSLPESIWINALALVLNTHSRVTTEQREAELKKFATKNGIEYGRLNRYLTSIAEEQSVVMFRPFNRIKIIEKGDRGLVVYEFEQYKTSKRGRSIFRDKVQFIWSGKKWTIHK